ncbi:MAG: hypothetical protein ABIT92_02560 [Gammaproteobacteria bacterium]
MDITYYSGAEGSGGKILAGGIEACVEFADNRTLNLWHSIVHNQGLRDGSHYDHR